MSVELEPSELGFRRPFTHEVSQTLRLHNSNSDPVAFKVKTTAPKQYCVRPNSGRIEPGRNVEVQVLLQAMKEDPPPDARCRDKFLVQSVAVRPDSDATNVSQIWANIEQTAKSTIQEKKIRVTFLPAEGPGATTNGLSAHEDSPPAYSSPSPAAVTPQRQSTTPSAPADREIKNEPDTTSNSFAQSTGLATAGAAISNAVPANQDDMKRQLDDAKATIARLQEQAAEGLRQRKPQEAAKSAVESVQQSMQNAPAPGGVPIQYVAALCLLCFLIAYLFF